MQQMSDEDVHRLAKERVGFKQHAAAYVIVNSLLIGLWFVTGQIAELGFSWATFWPVWPMLGWGVGLAFHAYGAYGPGHLAVAREEERIRQKQQ